jgi:hypothetical protein
MKKNLEYSEVKHKFLFIIGIILLLLGFIVLFTTPIFSIAFITLGLKMSLKQGFQIDYTNNKLRTTNNLLFFTFGKWQEIPKFEYLTIYIAKEKSTTATAVNNMVVSSQKLKLNLFYERNKKFTILKTKDHSLAFEIGEKIAKGFNIGFLDSTNPLEQKWVFEPEK